MGRKSELGRRRFDCAGGQPACLASRPSRRQGRLSECRPTAIDDDPLAA
jgi:hypothetical protein